jgi:hypothetical protein
LNGFLDVRDQNRSTSSPTLCQLANEDEDDDDDGGGGVGDDDDDELYVKLLKLQ